MQKFSIYIKSNKFYWNAERLVYSIIFFCCGVTLVKQKVFNQEENFIDKFFMVFAVFMFAFGVILKLYNLNKYEAVRGKLEGYLSFQKESITVSQRVFSLDDIRNIKISNEDYSGKLINTSKGNLGPALSNGTQNFIIIYFESEESKKYQFELINSNDFQKVRDELISYFLNSKIEFDELAKVLGVEGKRGKREFKIEIEKVRNDI